MKYFIISIYLLISNFVIAQQESSQIEINPYIRYDTYQEFLATSYPLFDNYVTPKGTSYGINVNFKKSIIKKYKLLIGLGYYRNTFNNIKNRNRFGVSNSREISFLSPLFIPFFTDRYWYHSLAINIGGQRDFMLKNNFLISIGAMANNYFTFSQYYHLTNNPGGSLDYKKKDFKYSGMSVTIEAGLQKKINRISVGPKLIIPVYTNWKWDKTLLDVSTTGSRSKWLRGIGLGVSFNYSLTSKK